VDLYAFTFYMLTVLHAVHVIGGLAALGVTTTRAFLGRDVTAGVRYCTVYWHFLLVVWLIVFVVMMIAS
jgi:cytochrome c oxidase subunit 3